MRIIVLLLISILAFLPTTATAEYLIRWTHTDMGWRTGCSGSACFVSFPIAITRKGYGLLDRIGECTKNEGCKGVVTSIAAYYGVPAAVTIAAFEGYNANFLAKNSGNESHFFVTAPSGYKICTIAYYIWSISTADGQKTPSIAGTITFNRSQARFYANVPRGNFSGGGDKSWLKTMIQVTMLKANLVERPGCRFPKNSNTNSVGVIIFDTNDGSPEKGLSHVCKKPGSTCPKGRVRKL